MENEKKEKVEEKKHSETPPEQQKPQHHEVKELKKKNEELESKLKRAESEIKALKNNYDELNSKSAGYLNTASYYKNQAEETKRDFDRYKERNKGIETEANNKAKEMVIKKLLPIIDDFNHAVSSVSPEVMKGFVMIYSSMTSLIGELGAVEIKSKGEDLNPEKHNCIDTTETDDETLDGKIANVYQKGYSFGEGGTVIRPATVSVYKFKS